MSKKEQIVESIVSKFSTVRSENGYDYFSKHKILDSGNNKTTREPYTNPSHVTMNDLQILAKHASSLVDSELSEYNKEAAKHTAVEFAVKTFAGGKFDGKINSVNFYKILNLMNLKVGGIQMKRTAKYYTDRLDRIANDIRELVLAGELDPKDGYALETQIDEVSDEIEGKQAKAIEFDKDEDYMKDFGKDPATKNQDSDEDYMKEFHNFGQNVVNEAMNKGEFDPKKKVGSLDASKLAAKRK